MTTPGNTEYQSQEQVRQQAVEQARGEYGNIPIAGDLVALGVGSAQAQQRWSGEESRLSQGFVATREAPSSKCFDYLGFDHAELKAWSDAADAGGAGQTAGAWTGLANAMAELNGELDAANKTESAEWKGTAGESAGAFTSGTSGWADSTGQYAQLTSHRMESHSTAASTAKNAMPEPIPFSWDQEVSGWSGAPLTDLPSLINQSIEKHAASQAAHQEAAQVMATRDTSLTDSAGSMPSFQPPPTFASASDGVGGGGSGGSVGGTGGAVPFGGGAGSGSGSGTGSGAGSGGNGGGGGSVPSWQSPPGTGPGGPGSGGAGGPGQSIGPPSLGTPVPDPGATSTAGYSPGPGSDTTFGRGPGATPGSGPGAGGVGFGGAFGPGAGSGAVPGAGAGGGSGAGGAPGAGSRSGVGGNGFGPTGANAARGGAGSGGMGRGGMGGMMGGAGRGGGKGDDDTEHSMRAELKAAHDVRDAFEMDVEHDDFGEKLTDPETGWTVVPPVIGE